LNQDISRPTTLKKRFKVDNKSIIKVIYLNQDPISKIDQNFIFEKLNKNIKKIDLIILSDFNYGCLPQNLVEKIIKIAKKNKIFVSADSQSSSQIGDIARFKNIDLITPTEKEARIGVKNNTDGLVVLINKLQKITKTKNIILTLAADGILIQKKFKKIKNFIHTDKIPAINKNPKDVSGAGDALLVMSSLMLASGSSIWEASFAGSLFAALQANSIGNTPINKKTFLELIRLSMDH
jgi:rfaE bifunctional protein kinase chain/domain